MLDFHTLAGSLSRKVALSGTTALSLLCAFSPVQAKAAPAAAPTVATANYHLGDILQQHPLVGDALLRGAARGWFVRYLTSGEDNTKVWANGVVLEPPVPAPKGGYQIVTYGHGAKGDAGKCQPAVSRSFNHDVEYKSIAALLRKGYAVTLTDFPVINGVQPFVDGPSEGASILDIVRAAHKIDPLLSNNIAIGGYSQGAQGAFAAAHMQPTYAPEYNLKGLFGEATPWGQELIIPDMGTRKAYNELGLSAAIGLLLAGFRVSEPQYGALSKQYLTPKGLEIVNNAARNCLMDGWVIGAALTNTHDLFRKPVKDDPKLVSALIDYIRTPTEGIKVPVLLTQGTNDPIIKHEMTEGLFASLKKAGTPVTLKYYRGADHNSLPDLIPPAFVDFLQRVMPNEPVAPVPPVAPVAPKNSPAAARATH